MNDLGMVRPSKNGFLRSVKKSVVVLLVCFSISGLLVGCGGSDSTETAGDSESSQQTTTSQAQSASSVTDKGEGFYESPVREIDQGIGNIVFSKDVLDKGEEESYELQEEFKPPTKTIHMRAFYPKTFNKFAEEGKLWNELKSERQYHQRLEISPVERSGGKVYRSVRDYNDYQGPWSMQRFVIKANESNDFQNSGIDLAEWTRKVSSGEPPHKADVCISLFFWKANKMEEVIEDGALVEQKKKLKRRMAEGCFQYIVEE